MAASYPFPSADASVNADVDADADADARCGQGLRFKVKNGRPRIWTVGPLHKGKYSFHFFDFIYVNKMNCDQ